MRVYDRDGKPIATTLEYAAKLEDPNYKRVASSYVGDFWVSTVWLGLDHSFGDDGPPIIFETMMFAVESGAAAGHPMDQSCWRYSTEEEALKGHADAVALIKTMIDVESQHLHVADGLLSMDVETEENTDA